MDPIPNAFFAPSKKLLAALDLCGGGSDISNPFPVAAIFPADPPCAAVAADTGTCGGATAGLTAASLTPTGLAAGGTDEGGGGGGTDDGMAMGVLVEGAFAEEGLGAGGKNPGVGRPGGVPVVGVGDEIEDAPGAAEAVNVARRVGDVRPVFRVNLARAAALAAAVAAAAADAAAAAAAGVGVWEEEEEETPAPVATGCTITDWRST